MRTREEIIAKYRKTPTGVILKAFRMRFVCLFASCFSLVFSRFSQDAHAAASQARDKLAERGEKLAVGFLLG